MLMSQPDHSRPADAADAWNRHCAGIGGIGAAQPSQVQSIHNLQEPRIWRHRLLSTGMPYRPVHVRLFTANGSHQPYTPEPIGNLDLPIKSLTQHQTGLVNLC
jgi:hypothetical protein